MGGNTLSYQAQEKLGYWSREMHAANLTAVPGRARLPPSRDLLGDVVLHTSARQASRPAESRYFESLSDA